MTQVHRIRVDIWIDYACPYSWLHTTTIDAFRAVYGAGVEVHWHPFEMRPEPEPLPSPDAPSRHEAWAQRLYPLALERGVSLRMPPLYVRSRLAFEVASWASDHGRFDAVHRALFEAYFGRGEDIGDIDTLVRIATSRDDEANELRHALEQGWYASRIERHKAMAARLGVDGIPFTVISRAEQRPVQYAGAPASQPIAPVVLRGVAPLSHFHEAVRVLFPDGYLATPSRDGASWDPVPTDAAERADSGSVEQPS